MILRGVLVTINSVINISPEIEKIELNTNI